ncbi:subtilisin-like protein [Roridomyces roridus]|uniref:Subtilisin-like protein n=1 Tax=Roridomyces roridus TaxID=1738132 RepID=A0AAD7BGN9_9AGAR|nr:subtilisin-like protein [Roridomyces roridus]
MAHGADWIGMSFLKIFHLLALAALVSAGSFTPHDSRSAAPAGIISEGAALDSDQLTLRFALAGNNISGLHDTLTARSTPGNAAFRQWLSADEVKEFVKPSSETLAAFENFTSANGLSATSTSPQGNWVSVNMSVFQANTLFRAQYQRFSHPSLAEPLTRTLAISLPSELVGHVDAIHPGTDFSIITPQMAVQRQPSFGKRDQHPSASCNTSIPSTAASARTDTRILVTGFVGRSPSQESLSDFLGEFRPDIPKNTSFNLTRIDNSSFVSDGTFDDLTLEADIDVQYTVGVATGVPVDFLSVGGDESLSSLATAILDQISFVAGMDNPPSTMTSSFGVAETDVGVALATSVCNGLASLSARGISVLFSSGDGGVHGSDDDLSLCNTTTFVPAFPASCPWVTTVGATIGFGPEIAMNLTSGGFSDVFPRPSYQEQAVESFLAELPKDFPGTFNTTGRGYPDVAIQANNFAYVSQGVHSKVGGTSLSSPTFASIIALVNDRLLGAREQPLGFLNPWIYKHADAFTDITAGHNSGDLCPESSVAFDAVKGWDPLTGVGTPVFDRLLQAAFAK